MPVTTPVSDSAPTAPTDYAYWERKDRPGVRRLRALTKRTMGFDLCPSDEAARAMTDGLWQGDPVAEAFVAEVFGTPDGRRSGRALLELALTGEGVAAVPDAPQSMQALFAEFETVPDWVDAEQIERGAAIWRRWGTDLFAAAGAYTLEMYTESPIAVPLSLAGGYAGDKALHRFLETVRFWIDISEPGALLTQGSAGRATAMRVRVMHVSVRERVATHDEWDMEAWGVPIGQTPMLYTLIGGSTAPAMALWLLGHITTPAEVRALLHYQRYLGHLLGVHPEWYPESVRESLQVLAFATLSRTFTAGDHGRELIESFPDAFRAPAHATGLGRARALYLQQLMAGFSVLYTSPLARRGVRMPSLATALIPLARTPAVIATDLARIAVPGVAQRLDRRNRAARERWLQNLLGEREARFEANEGLRR